MKKKLLAAALACIMLLPNAAAAFADAPNTMNLPEAAEEVEMASGAGAAQNAAEAASKTKVFEDEWTVMLYLCGTDLESDGQAATFNIIEIMSTEPSEEVNFVIQTGGTKTWHTGQLGLDIASDKLQRYSYGSEGFVLEDEQMLAPMSSASTLADFIEWSAEKYPAEKYMLVLWDHGGGDGKGLIVDELYNNSIMTLYEMERALAEGGVHFESIVLDACLTAGLDTARALVPHSEYLLASQASVPGAGSDYYSWLQYLYNEPDCDGEEFGRVFCDSIVEKYNNTEVFGNYWPPLVTFSNIRLSAIEPLDMALSKVALEMRELLSEAENYSDFALLTDGVETFGNNMIDLKGIAQRTAGLCISERAAHALGMAVDLAVVYNVNGPAYRNAGGISIYYKPNAKLAENELYGRVSKNAEYLAFLDTASTNWTAPEWVYEKLERVPDIKSDEYFVKMEETITAEGDLRLNITNAKDAVMAVDYELGMIDEETGEKYSLGKNFDVSGDFEAGVFYETFDGKWSAINDKLCNL
ncbi:MAG: hypothetical protein IJC39_05445, partial [Firmicutes bacterium]|nr:hypothetical protein [Bacillota bacterium]